MVKDMEIVWKVPKYIFHLYTSAIILCFAFLLNRYAIEVEHIESSHLGVDTWLTTLMPDSIVFDTDSSFMHVHKVSWKARAKQ